MEDGKVGQTMFGPFLNLNYMIFG